MGSAASCQGPAKLDKHAVPPRGVINEALLTGRCIPCELAGPYALGSYHKNTDGRAMGFESAASFDAWFEAERARLAAYVNWERWREHADALETCSAEFVMVYGHHAMGGRNFDLSATRPRLEAERRAMIAAYEAPRHDAAAASPAAFHLLTTDEKYASSTSAKALQPHSTIAALFRGSIEALPQLAQLARDASLAGAAAAAESEAAAEAAATGTAEEQGAFSWSVKKLGRVSKKLVEKYEGKISRVNDVARASIVFRTLAGLLAGFDHVLRVAPAATAATAAGGVGEGGEGEEEGRGGRQLELACVKNRFVTPCDGYSDVLLNMRCANGTLVELQLHLASIYAVKGEAGHGLYKWIRRILLDVDELYDGDKVERNGIVLRHGQGSMLWASGARYEGGWINGLREGQGTYTFPDGDAYVGAFENDKMHGEGRYSSNDGSSFVGRFEQGRKACGVYYFVSGAAQASAWDKEGGRQMVGEGVKWSRDRQTAWLAQDGEASGAPIPLKRASEIAAGLGVGGELPPSVHLALIEGEEAVGPPDEREVTKGLTLVVQKFTRKVDGATARLVYEARNATDDMQFELSADFKGSKGVELVGAGSKLKATVQVPPGGEVVRVAELKVNGADGFALKINVGCVRQRAGAAGAGGGSNSGRQPKKLKKKTNSAKLKR